MLVRSLRRSTAVVNDVDFPPVTFPPDEPVEVPDALGRKLLQQTDRFAPVPEEPHRQQPDDNKEA